MAVFPQTTFDEGVKAYEDGDYAAAADTFRQLVAEGAHSAAVFYNLGNSYYKLGLNGPAVLNYERALRISPGMRPARRNLDRALREAGSTLARPGPPAWEEALLFWHQGMPYTSALYAALAAWFVLLTLLGIRQWRAFPYAKTIISLAAILALATALSAYAKSHPRAFAVSLADDTPVRYGTSTSDDVRFILGEGDRVAIEEQRPSWMRIRTAEEGEPQRGWVAADALAAVGPPYGPIPATTYASLLEQRAEPPGEPPAP